MHLSTFSYIAISLFATLRVKAEGKGSKEVSMNADTTSAASEPSQSILTSEKVSDLRLSLTLRPPRLVVRSIGGFSTKPLWANTTSSQSSTTIYSLSDLHYTTVESSSLILTSDSGAESSSASSESMAKSSDGQTHKTESSNADPSISVSSTSLVIESPSSISASTHKFEGLTSTGTRTESSASILDPGSAVQSTTIVSTTMASEDGLNLPFASTQKPAPLMSDLAGFQSAISATPTASPYGIWVLMATPLLIKTEDEDESFALPLKTYDIDYFDKDNNIGTMSLSRGEVKFGGSVYKIPSSIDADITIKPTIGSGTPITLGLGIKSKKSRSDLFSILRAVSKSVGDIGNSVAKATDGMKKVLDSGFSDASISDFSNAIDDATGLANDLIADMGQMASDYEMNLLDEMGASMPEIQTKVFDAYEGANALFNKLRPVRKILKLFKGLQNEGALSAMTLLKTVFAQGGGKATTAITLTGIAGALSPLALVDWSDATPIISSPTAAPVTSTRKGDGPARKGYWIITHHGTSLETFNGLLLILPKTVSWKSDQTEFPTIDWQHLIVELTDAEAIIARNHPAVNKALCINDSGWTQDTYHLMRVLKDAKNPKNDRRQLDPLKVLQWPQGVRSRNLEQFSQLNRNSRRSGYAFDAKLGKGSTIYVFDAGFDAQHPDFQQYSRDQPAKWMVVPPDPTMDWHRLINPNINYAPESIDRGSMRDFAFPAVDPYGRKGFQGHGTPVLDVAAGRLNGVAPNANIVGIKLHASVWRYLPDGAWLGEPAGYHWQDQGCSPSAVLEGFRMAFRDFDQNRASRQGKTVFVWAASLDTLDFLIPTTPSEVIRQGIMLSLIKELQDGLELRDILLVLPSGNNARDPDPSKRDLSHQIPQNLETEGNRLLIVGAVDRDGRITVSNGSPWNDPAQVRIYAQGMDVVGSETWHYDNLNQPLARFTSNDLAGTSFAAPQIAGLAAYFMTLPDALKTQPGGTFTARGLKRYLIDNARELYSYQDTNNPQESDKFTRLVPAPLDPTLYQGRPVKVGYNMIWHQACFAINHGPLALGKARQTTEARDTTAAEEDKLPGNYTEFTIDENNMIDHPEVIDWDGIGCNATESRSSSISLSATAANPRSISVSSTSTVSTSTTPTSTDTCASKSQVCLPDYSCSKLSTDSWTAKQFNGSSSAFCKFLKENSLSSEHKGYSNETLRVDEVRQAYKLRASRLKHCNSGDIQDMDDKCEGDFFELFQECGTKSGGHRKKGCVALGIERSCEGTYLGDVERA